MLIGYDGQSDWLKLVATGEYGLEELAVEFNPGQVMYAFCSVLHPKTKLKAFLIINWVKTVRSTLAFINDLKTSHTYSGGGRSAGLSKGNFG